MKAKYVKDPTYVTEYDSYKKLYEFTKLKSPISILFCTEDKDEWLIDIVKYRTRSQEVTNHFVILRKDLERWIEIYTKQGFVEK